MQNPATQELTEQGEWMKLIPEQLKAHEVRLQAHHLSRFLNRLIKKNILINLNPRFLKRFYYLASVCLGAFIQSNVRLPHYLIDDDFYSLSSEDVSEK